MKERVLIASPVNLLALLLTIAKGWQSHQLDENAEKVAKLAKEMYERVGFVLDHVVKMGNNLKTVNISYDGMIGSMETLQVESFLRQFLFLCTIKKGQWKNLR
jgi:DNA recombination protein RmuC